MISFLENVSHDIINKFGYDLSRTAIVFPNKRASLFMDEYLSRIAQRPMWSPAYMTISDLFRHHSSLSTADPIRLIFILYRSFVKCTGSDERLDHFYGWGQLLLADFDDIDKNMGDAEKIFTNLQNIHELDDISYLTKEQKDTIKKFFHNFDDGNETELKRRFYNLWQHFGEIYADFNRQLKEKGMAYEGALYRSVVTNDNLEFRYDRYIFVGFNMLHTVEQELFSRLKSQGKAFFYWDFDHYYMPTSHSSQNEAGVFIAKYLQSFPNELDNTDKEIYDNLNRTDKNLKYISATTENIQARYIGDWLKSGDYVKDGRRTAIVMCDENILQSVLYCLPPETNKVNITTGYPLKHTSIASFITRLLDFRIMGFKRERKKFYYYYVSKLFAHPLISYVTPLAHDIKSKINTFKYYYPSDKSLTDDEGLTLLFSLFDVEKQPSSFNVELLKWVLSIIKYIGIQSKDTDDALLQESIFRMYTIFSNLASLIEENNLVIDSITLRRLIKQLVDSTTIPFHGEPILGIQIMGILETRNLDFDNLLIMSCNEGIIPRGINDASFIPYSIRKAYGLTTIDHKVAIYSYYFHRLIQRAQNITFMYNNSTEDGHTGEMSRFMLQLMIESKHHISRENLIAGYKPLTVQQQSIEKSNDIMDILDNMGKISPSAINQYLRCALQFYYNHVAHIREPENIDDDNIDNRIFGNIFHKSAYHLYNMILEYGKRVSKKNIEYFIRHEEIVEQIVDRSFQEEYFKDGDNNKTIEYNGIQLINKKVIISYLKQLLKIDSGLAPFSILGLEQEVYMDWMIQSGDKQRTIKIGGFIDRLDQITNQEHRDVIRVIDYKTGYKPSSKIKTVDNIFLRTDIGDKHSDYFLQALLYSIIINESTTWNDKQMNVSPALFFIKQSVSDNYDPTLSIEDKAISDINEYSEEFKNNISIVLNEIFNSSTPFIPTDDKSNCVNCPYKQICEI